jgi:hypothetical protein
MEMQVVTATDTTFQHTELDRTADSIRLIRILPELSSQGRIQCTMWHTTIANESYTCLSYEWGLAYGGGMISINGRKHCVGQNLLYFLAVAMNKLEKPAMWIDALCIDQGNSSERNHQVGLMGKIYARADEVWAWFGNDSKITNLFNRINVWNLLESTSVQRYQIRNILGPHSYWSRAWITQEIVLARQLRLLAGREEINATKTTQIQSSVRMLREASGLSKKPSTLITLLHRFDNRQCSVSRDIIYSLLALCQEGAAVKVDYRESDTKVLLRVLDACSKFICFCSAPIVAKVLGSLKSSEGRFKICVKTSKIWPSNLTHPTQCSFCHKEVKAPNGPKLSALLICLRNVCQPAHVHIFWNEANKLSIVGNDTKPGDYNYSGRSSGFKGLEHRNIDLFLPLRALCNIGTEKSPNGLYNPAHLDREKNWLDIYDPSKDWSTRPYIWINDRNQVFDWFDSSSEDETTPESKSASLLELLFDYKW